MHFSDMGLPLLSPVPQLKPPSMYLQDALIITMTFHTALLLTKKLIL